MNDETIAPVEEAPPAPAQDAPTETLEDIASQFAVPETPTPQTVEQPVQPPQAPQFQDSEQAAQWSAQQIQALAARQADMERQSQENAQNQFVEKQVQALSAAVQTIGKEVDITPTFIEGALHVRYNRDKNFRTIFDNRDRNPAAFQRALGIVAKDLKAESVVATDPQLAEDARALEQLQKSVRTGKVRDDANEKWKGMSAADFDREWQKVRSA